MFTGAGDGIIILSTDARLVEVNESFARMHGYSCQEMQQFGLEDLDTPESSLLAPERIRRLLTGETLMFEVEHYHRDGHIFPLEVLAGQVSYGGESYLQCFHREITERREHEKELLKIEKLESLGALAGGIAHDFNNILTGIMGNISFAQMFLDAAHKSYKPLAEAEKASLRAGELANQLLTFARGGDPVKKVVSLQHLVNETISLVLRGSNVKGTIEIPDSIHAIEADEGQMTQVFHNIIINATQAMPGGGTLTVIAQNEMLNDSNTMSLPGGSYVRLSFTDQGCGISDGDLKRIFDPYFTTKSSGNGLGLASVHSIVNRHGGHIGVSSVTGKGSTFSIHLPSIGETYSINQSDSVVQSPGADTGGSILVMDDEEMIREMTIEMLEYMGYQATACENGAEAIAQYKAAMESGTPFSVVIMDLTIPGGMGGKEAAEQILAIDPQVCLIVSSGYSNDPVMSDYSTFGFNGAIAKPYNMMELEQLLSSVLSAK
ncbi:MAG: PAS domain S-box protein [Verrucomicrobia bacterium]|nr:PAS domain S-box protein [Deltaproteobacteria bacterium]